MKTPDRDVQVNAHCPKCCGLVKTATPQIKASRQSPQTQKKNSNKARKGISLELVEKEEEGEGGEVLATNTMN